MGNHVRIDRQPKRIVSLDPRDTETLFALGLENRVVGDGGQYVEGAQGFSRPFRYPGEWPSPWGKDYPVRAKKLTHVEGGFGNTPFSVETVVSLRPDLILSLKSDLPTLQKMRDLGYKVLVLNPGNLAGIYADMRLVGRTTGNTSQAATVVANMQKQLAALKTRMKTVRIHPSVYYEIDATNPTQPYSAGPGTFIDQAIHLAGARNVLDNVSTFDCPGASCFPQINLEALVKLNPQVILLGDAAYGTTVNSVKRRTGWSTIRAVITNHIYPFNDELISRAGPRIVIGIEDMARLLHPAAFKKA